MGTDKEDPGVAQFHNYFLFLLFVRDMRNTDIAEVLHLSPERVTQLVNQVEIKLKQACQQFGLIEQTVLNFGNNTKTCIKAIAQTNTPVDAQSPFL